MLVVLYMSLYLIIAYYITIFFTCNFLYHTCQGLYFSKKKSKKRTTVEKQHTTLPDVPVASRNTNGSNDEYNMELNEKLGESFST